MTSTSFNFLLIGKSGVGKTATFNSILNKYEPNISPGPIKLVEESMQREDGTKVSAIDGLNVVEVREAADFKEVVKVLADVGGISAFLIIMKFGDRFTESDWDVILATKAVFGEDVLSRFGICVFTNGDMFKRLVESENENFQTIEEWLGKQSGKIIEVYEDCQRRVILFDNKMKVEIAKEEQRKKLFEQVVLMEQFSASKYTLSEFEDFDGKEQSIQRKRQKDMVADTQEKIKDFKGRFSVMSQGDVNIQGLIALEEELKSLKEDLEKEFSAKSNIPVPVRMLLIEVQSAIECENNKSMMRSQKNYDDGQAVVNSASQNEEFIKVLLPKHKLNEALENLTKLNEELGENEQVPFELKKAIESVIEILNSVICNAIEIC